MQAFLNLPLSVSSSLYPKIFTRYHSILSLQALKVPFSEIIPFSSNTQPYFILGARNKPKNIPAFPKKTFYFLQVLFQRNLVVPKLSNDVVGCMQNQCLYIIPRCKINHLLLKAYHSLFFYCGKVS